jgi:tetratricopeptide (TPR) repeat protein
MYSLQNAMKYLSIFTKFRLTFLKIFHMKLITSILVLLILFSCKQKQQKQVLLGVVDFDVSGKESALPDFEKGLLLLHSFEYEDAREAFKKAQQEDSNMAMAYWGEAMTYNHSLWHEQDYEAAKAILAKLDSTNAKQNVSQLEEDLIASVEILYQPKKEKIERDAAYSNFMEGLHKKYPNNQEVAAFYALSLLGAVPEGRDDELYGKGARIAKGILKENPNHPGALHYLIHSYDDPNHASLALDAANSYSKVAPDASHALHMPSHIYVAMGMWDQVISSNIDSYKASVTRKERKDLDNDALGYHAFHWLEYGYLQKNNQAEAKKMVLELKQFTDEKPSKRARVHLVFLKGTYLNETDDWKGDIAEIPVDVKDLNISVRSKYHFLEGMKAYKHNDSTKLRVIIERMKQDEQRESYILSEGSSNLCSNVTRDEATEMDLKSSQIRQEQLLALLAELKKDSKLAETHFLKSVELEESISYSYGPPAIQKPTHELYADWLISENRMEEAAEHYMHSLKKGPKRLRAMTGLEKKKIEEQVL